MGLKHIFKQITKDGKIIFIILATLLVTVSLIVNYSIHTGFLSLEKALLIGVPFSFAWVVFAWAITDQSILRKPLPYVCIFVAILAEKLYWAFFYLLFPPVYETTNGVADALALGSGNPMPSMDWLNLLDSAFWVFVFVEFFVLLIVFVVLWHLAKPKDFKKISLKKTTLVIFASFLMTMPLWIWRAIGYFGGSESLSWIIRNIDYSWYNLLFNSLQIAIAMVIFTHVITNIKSIYKFVLYGLIFLFLLVPSFPFFDFAFWRSSSDLINASAYFIVYGISYFIVFLSLLLLTKTKYIEQ
jgi:hypothetical protein